MANIYNEQVKSDLYHQYYTAEGNPSGHIAEFAQDTKEKSDDYLQKARNVYSDAISIQGQSALNELANNPELSMNPEKLGVEIDKVIGKMSSEIVDDEIKANFLAKSAISKSSYLNNAYAKALKAEEEKTKSTIFNKIYSDIDMIGTAFSNGMQGVSNEDDVINAVLADKDLTSKINAVNADGTFVFSDEQRRKFTTDRDNAFLATFKASFEGMTDEQKKRALSNIESDTMIIGSYSDGKDTSVLVNLKDVVSPNMYSDIKKFVREEKDKRKANEIKQFNLEKKYAYMTFLKNPTEENLQNYITLHPETSESSLDRLSEMVQNKPNFSAETTFSGMNEATSALAKIAAKPIQSEAQIANKLDELRDFIYALNKSNQEGKMSVKDKEEMAEAAYRMFNDSVFMEQVHTIFGKPGAFVNFANWSLGSVSFDRIESIGLFAIKEAVNRLLQNDPEGAKAVYAECQKLAIQERYPEIPFDNLKEGDIFWYGTTEQAFKFLGYGIDDVLVEVNPTTGAVVK